MCKHQKVLFTLKRKLYRTRLNILFSSYLDGEVQISRLYLPESQIGQHSPIQSHRGRKYFRRDRGGPQIPRRWRRCFQISSATIHNKLQLIRLTINQNHFSHFIFDISCDLKVTNINSLHISKSRPHPKIAAPIEAEFYNWTRIVLFSSLQFSWFSTSFIGPIL